VPLFRKDRSPFYRLYAFLDSPANCCFHYDSLTNALPNNTLSIADNSDDLIGFQQNPPDSGDGLGH
jgi:hypothetical protein